jgi:cytochrome c oxidase cbb3-type subunit 3
MNAFWSWYISILVVANTVGLVWLLLASSRGKKRGEPQQDTTGHVWDEDLRELNNPLPLWWLGLFLITVVFMAGYLVFYPGLGANPGTYGWTSSKEVAADLADNNRKLEAVFSRFRGQSVEQLENDPNAQKIGQNIFANNCAACHGSDAHGAKGYPNLTDSDWLYGGTPDIVVTTITKGRTGVMPPWGPVLGDKGVEEVANYVLTLSGQKADAAKAEAGKERYMSICVVCHGPEGKGNQTLGAPNLTDNIWLYGGTLDDIKTSIKNGRNGTMPAWEATLGPDRIRLVAAWVLKHAPPVEAAPAAEPAAAEPAPAAAGSETKQP